jgi:hypothetical protein
VRHDPGNLLRGWADGNRPARIGHFLPTAAGIFGTIGATGRISPWVSFSTGKDRSSAVSLRVAQTLSVAVKSHVRLRGLQGVGGARLCQVDCGGSHRLGVASTRCLEGVFAKRFACFLSLWRFL